MRNISNNFGENYMHKAERLDLLDQITSQASLEPKKEQVAYIKKNIVYHLPDIIKHRNTWSRLFSYDIPDLFKNLVINMLQREKCNITQADFNQAIVDICKNYLSCDEAVEVSDNASIARVQQICKYAASNYFEFDMDSIRIQSKPYFMGDHYQQLCYKDDAKNNASSLYNAKIYQRNTLSKFIKAFEMLSEEIKEFDGYEVGYTARQCDSHIEYCRTLIDHICPNLEEDWKVAGSGDWDIHINGVRIDIESQIVGFLEESCEKHGINFKDLQQKALVLSQREILSRAINETIDIDLSLRGDMSFRSMIFPVLDEVNPAPIRSTYKLFGDDINKDLPINPFRHELNINGFGYSIIRSGFCHSLEAAKSYVTIMIKEAKQKVEEVDPIIIVDNRLMYDVEKFFGGEREFIEKHKGYIFQAIEQLREDDPSLPEIKFIPINLPPKDYSILANKESNKESLLQLYNTIQSLDAHQELIQDPYEQQRYELCYSLFCKYYQDESVYSGEIAFKFALIIQIMLSFLPIVFSEGCKSNKDRGMSKKTSDEAFGYILQRFISSPQFTDANDDFTLENIFNISPSDMPDVEKILKNSTAALITQLNTGISGSKNTAGIRDLIKTVGVEKYFFTGNRELVKKVKS
jgi:hypothetical protein